MYSHSKLFVSHQDLLWNFASCASHIPYFDPDSRATTACVARAKNRWREATASFRCKSSLTVWPRRPRDRLGECTWPLVGRCFVTPYTLFDSSRHFTLKVGYLHLISRAVLINAGPTFITDAPPRAHNRQYSAIQDG